MLEPVQVRVVAWDVRASGVRWERLGSLAGFALVGWEGELLVLFGVPSSTSAHSAGVEDKGAHCLQAFSEYQHSEQASIKILMYTIWTSLQHSFTW